MNRYDVLICGEKRAINQIDGINIPIVLPAGNNEGLYIREPTLAMAAFESTSGKGVAIFVNTAGAHNLQGRVPYGYGYWWCSHFPQVGMLYAKLKEVPR